MRPQNLAGVRRAFVASPGMTERARLRLFVLAAAPRIAAPPTLEALSSLVVPAVSSPLRRALDEHSALLASSAPSSGGLSVETPAPTRLEEPTSEHLVGRLETAISSEDVQDAVYQVAAVGPWLGALLQAIDDAGATACTLLAWATPSAVAAASPALARPLALVRWETAVRQVLTASMQRSCVVLPPADSDELASVLAESLKGPGAEPAPVRPRSPSAHPDVLSAQAALANVLVSMQGRQDRLTVALPGPSPWTSAIEDAERRAASAAHDAAMAWEQVHERVRDADVLWSALWHTARELADLTEHALVRERRNGDGDVGTMAPVPLPSS